MTLKTEDWAVRKLLEDLSSSVSELATKIEKTTETNRLNFEEATRQRNNLHLKIVHLENDLKQHGNLCPINKSEILKTLQEGINNYVDSEKFDKVINGKIEKAFDEIPERRRKFLKSKMELVYTTLSVISVIITIIIAILVYTNNLDMDKKLKDAQGEIKNSKQLIENNKRAIELDEREKKLKEAEESNGVKNGRK